MTKLRKLIATMAAALACILVAGVASAYEVAPLRLELVPAEGRTTATIAVRNTRDKALPLEVKVWKRVIAADGTQTRVAADNDFVIFPPQVQVPGGQSQAVRIQYVGPQSVQNSEAYLVEIAEVPAQPDPNFTGLVFTYNFGVAVYVDPPRAYDRLSVSNVERTAEGLRLTVNNQGNKFGVLTLKRLTIEGTGRTIVLEPMQLREAIANPLVPPKFTRTVDVRIADLPAGQVRAQFTDPPPAA